VLTHGRIENWKRRAQLVDYCAGVADASVGARTEVLQGAAEGAAQRKAKAELFEETVKVCISPSGSSDW
jgi:hypothetical protein